MGQNGERKWATGLKTLRMSPMTAVVVCEHQILYQIEENRNKAWWKGVARGSKPRQSSAANVAFPSETSVACPAPDGLIATRGK